MLTSEASMIATARRGDATRATESTQGSGPTNPAQASDSQSGRRTSAEQDMTSKRFATGTAGRRERRIAKAVEMVVLRLRKHRQLQSVSSCTYPRWKM